MTDNAKSPILSKNVSSSIGLEPPLRFPGFEGNYVSKKLGDIIIENLTPTPKPDKDYVRIGLYCHAKGIFHEVVSIDKALDVDTMYVVQQDNLIVNITFAWEHAIAITTDRDAGKLVSHRFPTYAFRNGHCHNYYKFAILKKRFRYDLGVASPGGAGRNRVLNKKLFLEIPMIIPSYDEQQKIADFLSLVDERIEKQRQLVEVLKRYKRGLLFDIFNRKIQLGNNSAWRSVMLSDCCAGFDNMRKPISSELREKGTVPYYGANGVQDYVKDYIFDGNYVLLAEDGGRFDEFYSMPIAQFITGKSWVNNHAHVLQALRGFDTKFIYYALVHKDIRKYINGSSRAKLNQEDMWQIKIYTPCFDDQKKIASFMTVVDNMINQHEFRLAKLTDLKNAFLQQMFI